METVRTYICTALEALRPYVNVRLELCAEQTAAAPAVREQQDGFASASSHLAAASAAATESFTAASVVATESLAAASSAVSESLTAASTVVTDNLTAASDSVTESLAAFSEVAAEGLESLSEVIAASATALSDAVEASTTAAVGRVEAFTSAANQGIAYACTLPDIAGPAFDRWVEAGSQTGVQLLQSGVDWIESSSHWSQARWAELVALDLATIQADLSQVEWSECISPAGCTVLCMLLLLTALFLLYHRLLLVRRPVVYTQHLSPEHATQLPPEDVVIDTTTPGPLRAVALTLCNEKSEFRRVLSAPYTPPAWLSFPGLSGHLQTVFTARASPAWLGTPYITYTRELLSVDAGSPFLQAGEVALDWAVLGKARSAPAAEAVRDFHSAFTTHTPTVLICHGLAGGGSEHYVKNIAFELTTKLGYRCVVFNARGCGGSKIINGQMYCGAYTDDLRQVVASLRRRLPCAPLLAVGFSLGANILTKFVGEEGVAGCAPFAAVASLANPFDFILGRAHLESSWFMKHAYSMTLTQNLIALFKKHLDVLHADAHSPARQAHHVVDDPLASTGVVPSTSSYDVASVFRAKTMREFDKRLTRVVFGYATVDDYYRDAGSARFVKFIRSPTLLLSSTDDPISTHAAIPYDEASINPFVTLVTTERGGHSMDWYTCGKGGLSPNIKSWSADVVAAFFAEILANTPPMEEQQSASPQPIATPPPHPTVDHSESSDDSLQEFGAESGASSDEPPYTVSWSAVESPSPSAFASSSPFSQPDEAALEESVQAAMELDAKLEELASALERQAQQTSGLFAAAQAE